jgi:L-fuconolactonase
MTIVLSRCYAAFRFSISRAGALFLSTNPDDRQSQTAASNPTRRIDAHHHVWHFTEEEYGWIDDSMSMLRRDFMPHDLLPLLAEANVCGTVAVQARQTIEETRWLLELAEALSPILGVVGWLPIVAQNFADTLDEFAAYPKLKGLRHVVQGEPVGFLDSADFNRGIEALYGTGLTYDILIYARQLEEATRFVDRHPQQVFVVDHIAKPVIRDGEIENWSASLRAIAQRPNVSCKISGMVTEADPRYWTADQLKPYFDVVLEAFGPDRLMVGTDWPVLTVGCGYSQWWQVVESWIAPLTPNEQDSMMGGTAASVYGLEGHLAVANGANA